MRVSHQIQRIVRGEKSSYGCVVSDNIVENPFVEFVKTYRNNPVGFVKHAQVGQTLGKPRF